MLKKIHTSALAAILAAAPLFSAAPAAAHFQTLIPSAEIVESESGGKLTLDLTFTHPMEWGPVMEMGVPKQFGVLAHGEKKDLKAALKAVKKEGRSAYQAAYTIARPGDHIFYLEPAPYWEPAEQKMIIHYTKVVVDGFGAGEGWDELVGLPVEIEPLTRPYGLWSGNLFQGVVRKNGQPAPYAEVEVEYYNEGGKLMVPADAFATQVIKADGQGVFSYAMPRAGWWGFAALIDGDGKLKNPAGKPVDVELGGLIWVKVRDFVLAK